MQFATLLTQTALRAALDPEPPAASGGWLNGGGQTATAAQRANTRTAKTRRPNPKTQQSRKAQIMNEAQMTLVGNLVEDPELRFTPAGQPVAKFRVASTPRFRDKTHERVERRRQPVPHLHRVAPGR